MLRYDSEEEEQDRQLRDWFAGQALSGAMANWTEGFSPDTQALAQFSYEVADEMMRERDRYE